MIPLPIDAKVKDLFHLFEGKRSLTKDQQLQAAIYQELQAEAIRFLEQNLPLEKQLAVEAKLKEIETSGDDELTQFVNIYTEMVKNLVEIPNWEYRLNTRLNYFLDNLLIRSLKKSHKK